MNKELFEKIDFTILKPQTEHLLRDFFQFGIKNKEYENYEVNICILPEFVQKARKLEREFGLTNLKITTVGNFPFGLSSATEVYQKLDNVKELVDAIDIVVPNFYTKEFFRKELYPFANEILDGVDGFCALGTHFQQERGKECRAIIESSLHSTVDINVLSAVYGQFFSMLKTSTGFFGGAKKDDVKIMLKYASVKASGGINTIEEAQEFIDLGCSRVGSSGLINLLYK